MKLFLVFLLLSALVASVICTDANREELEEGERIKKRFGPLGYDSYDLAFISHEHEQGRFRRSTERDITEALKGEGPKIMCLDLTSGESLNFTLSHTPLIGVETEVYYYTREGRVKAPRNGAGDCLASGRTEDGGIATFSFRNGLFGMVFTDGYDFLILPMEAQRSKRDVSAGGSKVHVLRRRSVYSDDVNYMGDEGVARGLDTEAEIDVASLGTDFVIEMALFSDAAYWKRLQQVYPGREDEFLLTRVAASQALYGDREKVGFDVKMKVKLIEYWIDDPDGYEFQEDLGNNLKSFCQYTTERYFYDLHGLNTGVTQQVDRKIGLAYTCTCKRTRCFNALTIGANSFLVYAHEIGHTLGLSHPGEAKCPEGLNRNNSFMGGGDLAFDFTPCNKWELDEYLKTGRGECLFSETRESQTPRKYHKLPSALPGQVKTLDELCQLYSEPEFVFFSVGTRVGVGVCKTLYCFNNDQESTGYGRFQSTSAPIGLPCGDGMVCVSKSRCIPIDSENIGWDLEYLKENKGTTKWSKWDKKWAPCSRKCGTGVQIRRRVCRKTPLNLDPFCEGSEFKARLCNQEPCGGDPTDVDALRQARGDEVCKRFVENDENFSSVLPKAVFPVKVTPKLFGLQSKTCLVRCERVDDNGEGDPDAILPDGTMCKDTDRSTADLDRFGIELRCVRGHCVEFSDCPVDEVKDACGICNGDGSRCVTINIDQSYDVERSERSQLAVIPKGASYIDVKMQTSKNRGVVLELWSAKDQNIIGKEGLYDSEEYVGDEAVKHASSLWSYDRKDAFLRTRGPIKSSVVIKAFGGRNPITEITIRYANPKKFKN